MNLKFEEAFSICKNFSLKAGFISIVFWVKVNNCFLHEMWEYIGFTIRLYNITSGFVVGNSFGVD